MHEQTCRNSLWTYTSIRRTLSPGSGSNRKTVWECYNLARKMSAVGMMMSSAAAGDGCASNVETGLIRCEPTAQCWIYSFPRPAFLETLLTSAVAVDDSVISFFFQLFFVMTDQSSIPGQGNPEALDFLSRGSNLWPLGF